MKSWKLKVKVVLVVLFKLKMETKQFDINDFNDGINFSVDAGLINRLGNNLS